MVRSQVYYSINKERIKYLNALKSNFKHQEDRNNLQPLNSFFLIYKQHSLETRIIARDPPKETEYSSDPD